MSLTCKLIGAGNLAWNLGSEFQKKGIQIKQIFSRTEESAQLLANRLITDYSTHPGKILFDCDFFLLALKDDAILNILPQFDFGNKLVIHCSGSLPMNLLESSTKNFGVLYPLQTFSKNRRVDFSEVPVFIEANTEENLDLIKNIALKLTDKVYTADSEKRTRLHIAAVFACNFVNFCYALSETVARQSGFSFEILKPLIRETSGKIEKLLPADAQTGPAVRFDKTIISKHLEILSENEELADLYKTLSESIFNFYKK